jgi:hypothetical protein
MLPMNTLDAMSRRTPELRSCFDDADNIERGLEEDGHRTLDFVIYRRTYDSDDN